MQASTEAAKAVIQAVVGAEADSGKKKHSKEHGIQDGQTFLKQPSFDWSTTDIMLN